MIYYVRLLDNEPSSVTETHIVEKRKKNNTYLHLHQAFFECK